MKAKYSISLLVALILTTGLGLAIAQQPAPAPPEPPDEPLTNTFSLFIDGGYLGVYAENISRENMGRYQMSQPRGVGITQVIKDSPAEKAGLKKDDVILRLDGENITSVRKLNRLVAEIAPDQSVRVTVSRGGAEQEFTATIGRRNNSSMAEGWLSGEPGRVWKFERDPKAFKFEPFERFGLDLDKDGDLTFLLNNGRRIGVSTMTLNKQLADYFGITGGKGVLVTQVTEDGPAAKAGVKAGDVITAIDGEAVDSPGDISRVIGRKKEGSVNLTIIRNKSQQTIQVTPNEGGFSTSPGRPQMGRQIVIPRIEIPTMPDIDIDMPQIVIPSVPAVNVRIPPVRVRIPRVTVPRVRISRPVHGPI